MQATAYTYDPRTRAGSVLLDDGTPLPFDAAAFDAGGLRLLRPGQRVRIEVEAETEAEPEAEAAKPEAAPERAAAEEPQAAGAAGKDRAAGRRVTLVTLQTF
ncbi:hypothetical protein AB0A77_18745 [Streptomyces varsoviensis]|uniref:hypothetical protein n=1 Tax=Streptomyces varsoviensis TaxID=67373 RepID=UPI0033F89B39